MKLDRLKIIDDVTNELMFNMTFEEESIKIREYLLSMNNNSEEIKISYCVKCDSQVKRDIAYTKSILTDDKLTDEEKFNIFNTQKLTWESRCKLLKNSFDYQYHYATISDNQMFEMYREFVTRAYELYDPENAERSFLYESVKHLDPNTMTIDDLMINEDEHTNQLRGHCGYDSYEESNEYVVNQL